MAKRIKKTNFEYLKIDTIDEELKCAICVQPLDLPVYAPKCGHTFCQECIHNWLKNSSSCPTCRSRVTIKDYFPVQTRVVLNQLSRLRMKCLVCEQINIENREKHENICSKKIISCTSADIKCSWSGKREDLDIHLKTCPFTPIRPIIDQLKDQLETIRKTQIEQQCFIQAYVNKGHTLSHDCTATSCIAKNPSLSQNQDLISCSLCKKKTEFDEIAVHSCITKSCICDCCFQKHTQELKPLTFKRKLSLDDVDADDPDDVYRYLMNRLGPIRDFINVEDDDDEFIVDF